MAKEGHGVYDLVVVGAGMVGSAAAYHASRIPGISVCLVGPHEPKVRAGQEIFGCWFDEGRICRRVAVQHTWSNLAAKSIDRFQNLESETGINFYTESGYISVTTNADDFQNAMQMSKKFGLEAEDITKTWKKIFPFLNIPENGYVLWEKHNAGYVNPRRLVRAHQIAALKHGAKILRKIVSTIQPEGTLGERWRVVTECGDAIPCRKVLVAAGGFAALKPLFHYIAPGLVPDLELRTQTISFLKIGVEEVKRLKSMPTLVVRYPFENLDGGYILPPILYPDGSWYLKLGHGRAYEQKKYTLHEVREWYAHQRGIPECIESLARLMKNMLPALKVEGISGDGCLTAHTPNAEPYIDSVAPGFAVALGGNGYAAKASDEIGRLAARLVLLGEWESEIPRERVKNYMEI